MSEAAKKMRHHVGRPHRRSSAFITEAAGLILDGAIGNRTMAKSYHHRNESPMGIGNPATDPPA
jgi:hypothetical protein